MFEITPVLCTHKALINIGTTMIYRRHFEIFGASNSATVKYMDVQYVFMYIFAIWMASFKLAKKTR